MYDENLTIRQVYEVWKEYGFGDESGLVIKVIFAINDHDSIEGLELLPESVYKEILSLVKEYKKSGKFKAINSNGEQDLSIYMAVVDKHLKARF